MNVIFKEMDKSLSALTIIDHKTDPVEFHRIRMGFDAKSKVAPTAEDPNYAESSNVDRSLNTLYGISTPQNADKLNRTVEVLALLRWSKDQAFSLRSTGTALYGILPIVPSHGDPLVITLLLGGRLQPRLLVDEGSAMNILFKRAIADLKVKEHFAPPAYPVVGLGNNRIMPFGIIKLPISFIDKDKIANVAASFLIINMQVTFDGIIDRSLTHAINTLPSSCHRLMFFKTSSGAGVVYGDQTAGRELMRIDES